jgi:Domain of unknown function (DUF4440)
MRDPDKIAAELDACHAQAKSAFEHRDFVTYRELFSPELAYCRADGRVIGRDQLMRDVESQFRRLSWVSSTFVRESIEAADDRACEILTQTGSAGTTAFLLVHRIWELTRRGRYYWTKLEGRWRIDRVELIEEHVSGRFHFGLRSSIMT